MSDELNRLIDRLRGDRTSGASELVPAAIALLRKARETGAAGLAEAARALREAQPSMAPLHNLAAAALAEARDPGALDHFERRWQHALPELVRAAARTLPAPAAPRFVTCSFSGSVLACLADLAGRAAVSVACGEGRPAFEGRRMAAALAAAGARVELLTDAALALALPGADGLLVGADAVAPGWFLNKTGTAALAAAAARAGTPVFLLATGDKFLDAEGAARLRIDEHDPREVWDAAPPGVVVRNPYFERVPLEVVTAVISDGPWPRA